VNAITARTKGIIVNSPCNPTGALMSEEAMTAIADAAAKRGLWVVADVTYEKLVYDSHPHNLVRILVERHGDRTVICSATSKAYAMTGWRCGWAIAPAAAMRREYLTRRDRVYEWLTEDPRFSCVKPRGAFYLFPYVVDVLESTGLSTTAEFAEALLRDARVALTAGEGFDAPGYLRLSYATSLDRLREGVTRIHEFVRRRSAIRGETESAETNTIRGVR
jgi:aspartate aminotransferase